MADDVTEGQQLAKQAKYASEMDNTNEYEYRSTFASYETIRAVLGIARVNPSFLYSHDGLPRIKELQSLWAEGDHGAGHAGEVLSRIGGLLEIDDMLNPGNIEEFERKICKAAIDALKSGKVTDFIIREMPAIWAYDTKHKGKRMVELKDILKLRNEPLTRENIQVAFEEVTTPK